MKKAAPFLIGLSGKARAGKDTAAQVLVAEHGFTQIGFADVIKAMAYDIDPSIGGHPLRGLVDAMGWEEAKLVPGVRIFLQRMGASGRERLDKGVWVRAALRDVDNLMKDGTSVVISDVRYPNEAEAIRKRGGIIVRIDRPNVFIDNDVSETSMDDEIFEVTIDNDGTIDDLAATVRTLIVAPGS